MSGLNVRVSPRRTLVVVAAAAVVFGLFVVVPGAGDGTAEPTAPPASAPAVAEDPRAYPACARDTQAVARPRASEAPRQAAAPGSTPGATSAPGAGAAQPADLRLQVVVDRLDLPVNVTRLPEPAGVQLVTQRDGLVRIVDGDRLFPDPFLDLRGWVATGSEQGLYAIVAHPGYAQNGRLFAAFVDLDGRLTVAEYRRGADPLQADAATACAVIRIPMPSADHVGGGLVFGADGALYLGVGDGGGSGDPNRHGQRLDVLQAKILRLDVETAEPYGVPEDNPFVGRADARPEIWAYGLRNPWSLTTDPVTGDLWIADVGQARFEEANRAPAGVGGLNFGWNAMEGDRCYRGACDPAPYTLPVTQYGHDPACAIAGGTVYRGTALPYLTDRYVFGDFCSGELWSISTTDPEPEPRLLVDSDAVITHVSVDPEGRLLVTDFAGSLLRLEPAR